MADALVSAVLETVLSLLSSAVLQDISLAWGFKDELNGLETTLNTIQLVIHDAELKQRKSPVLQNWLRRLKNAAYDAENVLDRIATEGLRRRANSERGTRHRLGSFISLRNPLLFRFILVHRVKIVRGKLDALAEERRNFHLGDCVVENRFGATLESRNTSSLVNESEIYGRRDEKEEIMEKILGGTCSGDDLSVYAIQGMGGLGKTTLAQMVYNDGRTERHFELRIWVCVSDDFSVQGIVRAILESVDGGGGWNSFALDPLQRRLREGLRGKRYLLVLDDVWNENHRLWDELKEVLRCGSKGSVLIVTTRIEKVASMMAPISIHRINYLSEDDSWSLFRTRAFMDGEGEENFVAIGKAIVKKCGGLPLAIKALGSLMRFKSHEREWLAIKESEIWHLSDDENGILPALRLSYDNLQPQMRQCFVYCSIFPKDFLMEEDQLIQLWMANGYIHSNGQTDMYLTGHLIFKELVWRSFLQDVKINHRGNMRCTMHDLVHDLASSVMKDETYILEFKKKLEIPKSLHHLSFNSGSSWDVPDDKSMLKLPIDQSLRSIIVHEGNVPSWRRGFSSLLFEQEYLRALDVGFFDMGKLSGFIYKLEHLRYLVMSCNEMKRLPESLTHLHNLQTLKLTNSHLLLELPKGLKMMKNLWFLELDQFNSLLCTPPGLGDLTSLRRLSIFIVGQDGPHQIDQLKELDLGGKLSIQGLDNVRNSQDAISANLMAKSNLTSLSLSWKEGIKMKSAEHFEEVLQGLQPHQNMEKISITSYCGSRFPNWMSTLLFRKLTEISLIHCPRCEHLPPFGKLPSLTCLRLHRMDSIKCLDAESYGDGEISFPALTILETSSMPIFQQWSMADSSKSFPCLEFLQIGSCPKLSRLPKLPTLRSLFISSSSTTLLQSITPLASLKSLSIFSFEELEFFTSGLLQNHKALEFLQIGSLPIRTLSNVLDSLSALKTLDLDHCSNLENFPGDFNLGSLETIDIRSCHALTSFPITLLDGLPSLRSLSFQNCDKLKPLSGSLRQAASLDSLVLNGLPEVAYLPEGMQMFGSLRELRIWHCNGLSSLPNWMGSLEALSLIKIWYCEKLKSLPDGIKGLKSIRKLEIKGCPQLAKRCKKHKGDDWLKISHIPIINIDEKTIQLLD